MARHYLPGAAWEDLPARFGRPNPVQRRFRRWAREGIRDDLSLDGAPSNALGTVMLDASACEAWHFATGARSGGEEVLGRSRGGLSPRSTLWWTASADPRAAC